MSEKLAVLGPPGTYSERAAQVFISTCADPMELQYHNTIDDTFHAVSEQCRYGIIPIENTLDGYIQRTLDLMKEGHIHILQEIVIPVSFALVGNVDALEQIQTLYVQPTASGQCRAVIDSLIGIQIIQTGSNIQAYQKLDRDVFGEAAIVPQHMVDASCRRFHLNHVTDAEENCTRFIVVEYGDFSDPNTTGEQRMRACFFVVPDYDEPGLLYKILRVLYQQNVNLVSLVSRPTRKQMGLYHFYLEVNGGAEEKTRILQALETLNTLFSIKMIGIYSI